MLLRGEAMKLRKLTLSAVLAAAALILFTVEAQIPPLTAVPGVKLGLANVVTVFALFTVGPWWALGISLTRIILGSLITGQVGAMLYSLSGGLLAWCTGALLCRALKGEQTWVLSTLSAMAHNVGQIALAVRITETPALWAYLPVLLISAVLAGAFTGLGAQLVLKRLQGHLKL